MSELDVNAEGWREGREQMPLAPAVLVLSSLRLPVMSDRNLKNAARNVLSLEYQSESESEVVQLCPTLRDTTERLHFHFHFDIPRIAHSWLHF